MQQPLYVAFPFGAGLAYAPHAGQFVSPAPRTYKDPAHAQLANPTGRLYVCEIGEGERLDVVAALDAYPLDLLEVKVPGVGAQAEGAVVLRDMGPRAVHRWATHFRNDQSGGYHGGDYFETYARALEGFALMAAKEMERTRARWAYQEASRLGLMAEEAAG
jgi:hypothetical protein